MAGQRHIRRTWFGALVVPVLALATYGVASAAGGSAKPVPGGGSAGGAKSSCAAVPTLDPAAFPASPTINNSFNPWVPGMQYFLDGTVADKSGVKHPHRIATTVTDLTKVVDGVHAIVLFEQDLQDTQVQESELAFVAQDASGAVWNLGEYPEEYSGGKLTGAPSSWLSGVAGAHGAYAMLAHPQTGTPVYLQGLAPSVAFEDCASVFQTGQHVCVQTGCYDNVLVTDEFSPHDPKGGHQRKSYAPGIGGIQVAAAGGVDPESLQLTQAAKLCSAAFGQVRQQALAQDGRGYTVAKSVYAGTPAASQTLTAQTC